MTRSFLFFLLLFAPALHAQSQQGHVSLYEDVDLYWESQSFVAAEHKVETCPDANGSYICAIDGALFYGTDQGMELPRNQLTQLTLVVGYTRIELDVRNMFNISYDGALRARQFKIEKEGAYVRLYGFFSDGAGTYTVQWRIDEKRAVREVISTDERYFYWQE